MLRTGPLINKTTNIIIDSETRRYELIDIVSNFEIPLSQTVFIGVIKRVKMAKMSIRCLSDYYTRYKIQDGITEITGKTPYTASYKSKPTAKTVNNFYFYKTAKIPVLISGRGTSIQILNKIIFSKKK